MQDSSGSSARPLRSLHIETFDLDEVLRALSHPDRRAFVAACRDGPRAAGELAELSALSLATVSEHLKVLRKSGLLVLDKRGRFWMYRTDVAVVERAGKEVARLIETAPSQPPP